LQQERVGQLAHGLSPHAPYTVSQELLSEISDYAQRKAASMAMHIAESVEEVELLHQGSGPLADRLYTRVGWPPPEPVGGAIDYLQRSDALRPSSLLVHGVQLTADEIRRIAVAGASVVLCPRSNRQLSVGRAPVEALVCQGVNLCLGTDSLASNSSLSLWDEMGAALELYAPVLSAVDLLRMATMGGARALGLSGEMGCLTAGSGAHFQVVRPDKLPAMADLAPFLCQGERGREVAHLYLQGVDVLKDATP
jgi:cytosine/adenosine deaminase-related metal-dependent hydrolase